MNNTYKIISPEDKLEKIQCIAGEIIGELQIETNIFHKNLAYKFLDALGYSKNDINGILNGNLIL